MGGRMGRDSGVSSIDGWQRRSRIRHGLQTDGEEIRGDDPDVPAKLRTEERELKGVGPVGLAHPRQLARA